MRPVLRLGSTGTGADLELRVTVIVRPAEQRLHLEGIQVFAELRRFGIELALHLGLGGVLQQLVELQRAYNAVVQFVVGVDPSAQRLHFLENRLRFFLIIPETRVSHLGVEPAQASALAVDVKDTSVTPPDAL